MIQIATMVQFVESLEHILGFLVVLAALTLLWCVTALIGRFFAGQEVVAAPAPVPAPAPAVAGSGEEGPSEEEVAAISATVALLMGGRSRVISIRSSGTKDWSREGRREHFASHRLR